MQAILVTMLIILALALASAHRIPLEAFQHNRPVQKLQVQVQGLLGPITHHTADTASTILLRPRMQHHAAKIMGTTTNNVTFKTIYQIGNSEEDLPICSPRAVCNKIDLYNSGPWGPWIERQCRCPGNHVCKSNLAEDDGHTLVDKTRHFKLCEPVKKLPKCRYFRDATWTLISSPDSNVTEQIVHCHCPKNSITYLLRKQSYETSSGRTGYQYTFACSPPSRLRCSRKEPCRLFTIRKRQKGLEEVNTSSLCRCPKGHTCPKRHTSPGVLEGKTYVQEEIRTYSGYCMMDDPLDNDPLMKK